ncbi:Uncharacterized protein OBRU01_15386 [Operophtera brumata]|uniref:ATP-dependent RNA helicase n=1 Tax=Operophtera brumata TaxID=104452 RepID=A0A0L7L4D9_OPEBR|nr:Uncharacterized protein OBRU01_15386 [Operophtera brumata]
MSKKLKNMKWESVALEGCPISTNNFDGFVGLEECTSYGLDKESKRPKKVKNKEVPNKKVKPNLKNKEKPEDTKVPIKKIKPIQKVIATKLSNGFVVESLSNSTTPSQTNDISSINTKQPHESDEEPKKNERNKRNERKKKNRDKRKLKKEQIKIITETKSKSNSGKAKTKLKKTKLGEENTQSSDLTPEDMLTWAEFKIQEPIIKSLMELGRRDILGAAETGSGKTLAFGIPILSGILKLKEKAESKGLDVYEIPYKKGPAKKKVEEVKPEKRNNKKKKEVKESSEDGYSSGDDDDEDSTSEKTNVEKPKRKFKKAEDYLEEIEVPIRKKDTSVDDENDSDDENYRLLRGGPEIVVATPGRLWELINQGQPHLQQLDTVKFLAIDETDRMVERGHFEELTPLLERLNADEVRKASRQNFVFSATLTLVPRNH